MKVLLLTQFFPPEGGSAGPHMAELAESLAEKGHEVTVVTGFPNYPDGKIFPGFRRRPFQRQETGGYSLIRTFLFVTSRRREFAPRMINYLSFMLTALIAGAAAGRHDVVYFYSPPLFLGVTAALLGRLWRASVVMELNDLWPRAAISMGVIQNRLAVKLAGILESFVYRNATRIFTYSHRMRAEILKAGVPEEKVEIFNLWIDSRFFEAAPTEEVEEVRRQYGIGDKFVVMYTGLVGLAQGISTLVDAAEVIAARGLDDIAVVIVGGGPEEGDLRKRANQKGLSNVIMTGQQPRERMAVFMSAANVLVSHLSRAPHRVGTIPAKILSYMVAGKPILVGAEGEAADLVNRHGCGISVSPDDPLAMAEGILRLRDLDSTRLAEMATTSRELIDSEFERSIVVSKLEKRLAQLAASGSSRTTT